MLFSISNVRLLSISIIFNICNYGLSAYSKFISGFAGKHLTLIKEFVLIRLISIFTLPKQSMLKRIFFCTNNAK